jgi:hypothetical protein
VYTASYDSALDFSPRFAAFQDELTRRLNATYELSGKLVIDVGCGKGGFLAHLCSVSGARGIGFDKNLGQNPHDVPDVHFVSDWFDETYSGESPRLLACRHVLEHIAEPIAFLRVLNIHHSISPDTVFYFEVPNALYTLRGLGIWDLIYEHVSYFTPASFRTALETAGFEVINAGATFGDEFLYVEAIKSRPRRRVSSSEVRPIEEMVREFASAYHAKIDWWRGYLAEHGAQSVAIWGAGSKGINFLNVVPGARRIDALLDLNPRKHRRFAPGTGTEILAPAQLPRHIRSVVVMNPIYREEIIGMAAALDRNLEILQA